MANRNFMALLNAQWAADKFVCVGLDPDMGKIPDCCKRGGRTVGETLVWFCKGIIELTADIACAYKPNIAFFERFGPEGLQALMHILVAIREMAPNVVVVLDYKRADIGNTNLGYVDLAFDHFDADAVTVNPYFGAVALQPFLVLADKGIIVLCRTSNKGARELQDLLVQIPEEDKVALFGKLPVVARDPACPTHLPLYQYVAYRVARHWNTNGNCGLVVGATYPEELGVVRRLIGDGIPILNPGVGKQGSDVEKNVKAGMDNCRRGMIINSSSGIIHASQDDDFAEVAREKALELHNLINQCR